MRQRERLIHVRLSEDEEEIIKNNAKKINMQVIPYIRMVAQNPVITQIDYGIIAEHTKEIAEVRNSINRIIFAIEASNNYLPREIESIVEKMDAIFKSENKLLETLRNERTKVYEQTLKKGKTKSQRKEE